MSFLLCNFTAIVAVMVVVIGLMTTTAATAAPSISSSSAHSLLNMSSSSPSSSSTTLSARQLLLAGDGGLPLGSERRELQRVANLRILNSSVLTAKNELIGEVYPRPPAEESHIWAMALTPSEDSLFFLMNDRLWVLSLDDKTRGRRDATFLAGPWFNASNQSLTQGLALEHRAEVVGGGGGGTSSGKSTFLPRDIIHVADNSNLALRALSVNGTPLFSHNFSDLHANDEGLWSVAIDSARHVLYAASSRRILRMNITGPGADADYSGPLEHWIGPVLADPGTYADNDNPLQVRFDHPFISTSAISADGQIMYVADQENQIIRRIRTASGAVDTIAGSNRTIGSRDGPPFQARFDRPRGLALTPDGRFLFVAEFGGCRLRLVALNQTGGDALSVTTVATLDAVQVPGYVNRMICVALSASGDTLYIGRGDGQIAKLTINVSPRRSARPLAGLTRVQATMIIIVVSMAALVVLLVVGLSIVIGAGRQEDDSEITSDPLYPMLLRVTFWGSGMDTPLKSGHGDPPRPQLVQPSSALKRYSVQQLSAACDGFRPSRLVGKGGAAEVYRGVLASGRVIAVKMTRGADLSEARLRQFQAELDVLAMVRHIHLCSIIGYAAEGNKSFIVYPFVEGGTLHDCLHSDAVGDAAALADTGAAANAPRGGSEEPSSQRVRLSWKDRVSIARQVAKALRYLHEEVDPPVLHRDVKSRNVLLERHGDGDGDRKEKVRAYLSDFGLAKLGQSVFSCAPLTKAVSGKQPVRDTLEADRLVMDETMETNHVAGGDTVETYHVAGTPGYIAPEYYRSGWLTYKNDVYAFGVVLLELVTGRKAITAWDPDSRQQHDGDDGKGEKALTVWAKRKLRTLDCLSSSDEEDIAYRTTERPSLARALPRRVGSLTSTVSRRKGHPMQVDGVRKLVDPGLESLGALHWPSVATMLELAMECVRTDPRRRPRMAEVLVRLCQLQDGP